nr:Fic family protein [Streptococcus lutetiensis]
MKRLTVEQFVALHSQLITASGGMDDVRDKGLVESSLSNIFDTYFGVDQYPTIEEKASRLCCPLIENHAFLDGNNALVFCNAFATRN